MTDSAEPAPAPNEVELSIFGPGFGECVLVHLGDGEWMLVDSCFDQRRKEQPALAYLARIGVEVGQAVKVVVATHWHDDHVRGLAEVVARCQQARFVCTAALRSTEVLEILRSESFKDVPATREITQVFDILDERAHSGKPELALANRRLYRRTTGSGGTAAVWSLSPSDSSVLKAIASILTQSTGDGARVLQAPPPNHCSVALQVDLPGVSLLLGADVEETGDEREGWRAIVTSQERPQARADAFKVPHHGSATGHSGSVWEEMLRREVYAGLTPFVRGRVRLPTGDDVARICALSGRAYLTADPDVRGRVRREQVVEKQVREVTRGLRIAEPQMGHIRFRKAMESGAGSEWQVSLFGAAHELAAAA